MIEPIIFYHANCWDGFAAYWAAKQARGWEKAIGIPMNYGEPIDDDTVRGQRVLMVDFSMPRHALERIAECARSFFVYDHHKTAEEDLKGLQYTYFDNDRSGAMIVYEELLKGPKGTPEYRAMEYIQDRDLWRKELPRHDEVIAWLWSMPKTFATIDEFADRLADEGKFNDTVGAGQDILRAHGQIVDAAVRMATPIYLMNQKGLVVNCTTDGLFSEVAGELANKSGTFGAGWFLRADGLAQVSLRSRGGFDVTALARHFGGGGHKNAAGFEIDPKSLLKWIALKWISLTA